MNAPSPASDAVLQNPRPTSFWLAAPVALLILALWWGLPQILTAHAGLNEGARLTLENAMRDSFARVGEAVLLFWAASLVWRYLQKMGEVVEQSSQTLAAAERTAFFAAQAGETERFAGAMALLSSGQMEVRLGGTYALERLARESERDHGPIMEVLAATLRDRAAWVEGETVAARLDADLQAILTVIGRRHAPFDAGNPLDLHGTCLARAVLAGANLSGAFLYEANLSGAILTNADLRGARLWKADLSGAVLDGAHLEGADLTGAAGLSAEGLKGAHWDGTTKLPQHLRGLDKTATNGAAKNGAAVIAKLNGNANGAPAPAVAEDLKLPSLRV